MRFVLVSECMISYHFSQYIKEVNTIILTRTDVILEYIQNNNYQGKEIFDYIQKLVLGATDILIIKFNIRSNQEVFLIIKK